MSEKETGKAVYWRERLKKAGNLKSIQEIRDDMVEEIKKDGPVEKTLEETVRRIIELELLFLSSHAAEDCYDDLACAVIRTTDAMLPGNGTSKNSVWDLIFEEVLDYREICLEKTKRTEKVEDWDDRKKHSSEEYEIIVRTLTLGALLRRAEDEKMAEAVGLIKRSMLKFAIEKEQITKELAAQEARDERRRAEKEKNAAEEKEKTDVEEAADEEEEKKYREEVKNVMEKFSSPLEIKAELDKYVVGQEHAKRSISMVLWHHIRSMEKDDETTGQSILFLGNTGSGKTMIAKKIAEISGLPCVLTDASRLTENGWRGGDMEDVFARLFMKGRLARYGIVIFDEFDKLVKMGLNSAGEDVGKERQSIFLDIMEGVTMVDTGSKKYREYETKHILFIFTGAFGAMMEARKKASRGFGFRNDAGAESGLPEGKDTELRKELVGTGVLPELVGRLTCIEELSVMNEEEMYRAVTGSPDSELYKAREYVPSVYRKELVINEDYVRSIVSKMREASLGVRGCNNYFREKIMQLLFTSYEKEEDRINLTYEKEK